jgi:SnoaL-like protein
VTRTLFTGCALMLVAATLAACGSSSKSSAADQVTQKQAALYQIDQIESTWHKAASTHNVDLMMTLWAPGATFNIGTDTYTGRAQIRNFFATQNKAFMPQNHWESDTPSYKIKAIVNGNKATLYFECHYVDTTTRKLASVVGVDHNLQKINGKWLIVSGTGSTATLAQ